MKKKSTKIITVIVGVIIILVCVIYFSLFAGVKVNKVSEGVYETKVFTSTNLKFNDWFLKYVFSGNPGGCSAVAKTLENGDTIVGRNMDFYVSNKPAFVVRTKEKGKYETVGLAYYDQFIPDTDIVEKKGVPRIIYSMLPMFCQDVMNDQGLYVEVNMRYSEYDPMGELMFADTHTNPKSEVRKCIAGINHELCQNCATVKEAVEYVEKLDVYSPQSDEMQWNFCYLLADATGDYGLLEVADNEVHFLDKQQMQTNFYVTDELYEKQRMKCGVGRYDLLKAGIDDVKSEEDMFNLIDSVSYAQSYNYETCNYDARSEYIGENPGWDYYYVIDEKNQEEVKKYLDEVAKTYNSMSRQELKDDGTYWESSFTTIANCSDKTMRVRFYEDDSNIVELSLQNQLPKAHYVDARCISGNPTAKSDNVIYYQKKVRCHNRQIHKNTINKGGYRKLNQAPKYVKGFQLFDKVKYNNKECFIFGRRSSGSFDIRLMDGNKISAGVSYKKLKLLEKRKPYLTERRTA